MKRLQRAAVLLSLVEKLHDNDSWCGETHIQKSTYFLQELLKVPLDLDFILYKHGPYSFELSDEITAMLADNILRVEPRPNPYGPSLLPGEEGSKLIKENFSKTIEKYDSQTAFVAKKLGQERVASLERLATALYVTREEEGGDVEVRVSRIRELKPHISEEQAHVSVEQVDNICKEAANFCVKE